MMTAYVFDNSRLTNDGWGGWQDALIAEHVGEQDECEKWFADNYDINDFTLSFTPPRN